MKRLSFFSLLLGIAIFGMAQEPRLSRDERGKLMYYEVVDKKDTSAILLADRVKDFFKLNKELRLSTAAGDSLWTADGKFVIRKTAFMLARPSGEVSYQLYVGVKEGKYRFWLTDFIFIPYQRDRYGNFVPATSVGTPLEKEPGKLSAAEWASYVTATEKSSAEFAQQLKKHMSALPVSMPAEKTVPVITTQDRKW